MFYEDVVASLYSREINYKLVNKVSTKIAIPLIVAGGVSNLKIVDKLFNNGADKIVLNSINFKDLKLLNKISSKYGSQSTCVNIQTKKINDNYEVFYYSGRERTYINLFKWIKKINSTKVGEIILSSIDNDGMNSILDSEILKKIRNEINLPLIYSGGISNTGDIYKLKKLGYDGACIGSCLHYNKIKLNKIKSRL
ncbi:HisA/HisF-related TIM barrel protein [Candidatus Pelagibacter sp.]|nr:HisA/HisF-related TIM barrel protein [Candidatus Pelagibacter sp.]